MNNGKFKKIHTQTNEEIIANARQFSSKKEWRSQYPSMVSQAIQRRIYKDCVSHMPDRLHVLNSDNKKDLVLESIKKLIAEGVCKEQVLKRLGLHHRFLNKIQKKHNLVFPQDRSKVSEYEKQKIIDLYNSGTTKVKDLIEITGRSKNAIDRALSGIRSPRRKTKDMSIVIKLINEKKSVSEINKITGIPESSIRHYLLRKGKSSKTILLPCVDNKTQIIEMINDGKTQAEICRVLGLHSNTLNTFIKNNGLDEAVTKNYRYSTSQAELEILDIFKSFNPIHKFKYSGLKEIDVFFPNYKLGIEMCGTYWHRESYRGKTLHFDKMKEVNELGIRLITIFDIEWETNKQKWINIIKNKMGETENILYARNTKVDVINNHAANQFLNQYHLQGAGKNTFLSVALKIEEEVVACMTFGTHHRGTGETLLNRLAFKGDVAVVGGAAKMFKLATEHLESLNVLEIVTYSDNRLSDGAVYKSLGFEKDKDIPIDYFYFRNRKIFSKQSLKKTAEERKSGKTEYELRLSQGYDRVWDCGKIKWKYKKK